MEKKSPFLPTRMGIIHEKDHPKLVAGLKTFREYLGENHWDNHPLIDCIENASIFEDEEYYYPVFEITLKIPK